METLYKRLLEKRRDTFFLFGGPCAIESRECVFEVAAAMKEITVELGIPYVFKASFDKANRTSGSAFRGVGMEEGLELLAEVKREFGLPIITDIHTPEQAQCVAKVADILQLPAFLCRQTDLLLAAAKTGLPVNIKKAQFLAPQDMKNVAKKCAEAGNPQIFLCERGTGFGYNNLVVDMTGIVEMKKLGYPVVFDATHSVQKPGGQGDSTGGNREYVRYLARAAAAVGADGFFMEVHPEPDKALSDGPNMVPLKDAKAILQELQSLYRLVQGF